MSDNQQPNQPTDLSREESARLQSALSSLVDFFGAVEILAENDDRFYYVGRGPFSWRYGMGKRWLKIEDGDLENFEGV